MADHVRGIRYPKGGSFMWDRTPENRIIYVGSDPPGSDLFGGIYWRLSVSITRD